MNELIRALLHVLFPVSCPVCGHVGKTACASCLDRLCSNAQRAAFDLDGSFSWIYYYAAHQGIARELVLKLKYGSNYMLGREMGRCIARAMPAMSGCVLVPLPLHKGSDRKFNQAEAIARGISDISGVNVADALKWAVSTDGQTGKSRAERLALPHGVFCFNSNKICGKKIVIVDDVCTTGTTLRRAAEACVRSGAAVDGVIVWSRTV